MTKQELEKSIKQLNKSSKDMEDALTRENIGEVFSILKHSIQLCYAIKEHYGNNESELNKYIFYKDKYIKLIEMKTHIEIPMFEGLAIFREIIKEKQDGNSI